MRSSATLTRTGCAIEGCVTTEPAEDLREVFDDAGPTGTPKVGGVFGSGDAADDLSELEGEEGLEWAESDE